MKKCFSIIGLFVALVTGLLFAGGVASAGQDKVTLCHAAGLAGTTKFVTLTVGYPAAFGPAGHFYENGTPRAGHEQDYLGACEGDDDTTTTEPPTTTEPEKPAGPRCPPGMFPTAGKDGVAGNDECEYPPVIVAPPGETVVIPVPPSVTPGAKPIVVKPTQPGVIVVKSGGKVIAKVATPKPVNGAALAG